MSWNIVYLFVMNERAWICLGMFYEKLAASVMQVRVFSPALRDATTKSGRQFN